jgi:hypothetical protein
MADLDDVRRISLSLPGASEGDGNQISFSVLNKGKQRGFAWVWLERIDPKKGRVPNPDVIAIRTASLEDKEMLLASGSPGFFTEAHYNGYPAVLVRLADVDLEELEEVITEGWRCMAPKELVKGFEGSGPRS